MAKAKRPVSINGIEFDALISSEHTMEATVPEYPVETGFTVSDTIILNSETLSLVLYVTDYPVTWRSRSGHKQKHLSSVVKKLQELYYSRETVTVKTSDKTYSDMAIETISFSKSLEVGYAMEIPISLRQIRRTSTSSTTIPAEYGKSGATEEGAGTASTSGGAGGAGGGVGGAGGSGSGGRSGSYKGSKSEGKGSIAINALKNSGVIKEKRGNEATQAIQNWAEGAVTKAQMKQWTKERKYELVTKEQALQRQKAEADQEKKKAIKKASGSKR